MMEKIRLYMKNKPNNNRTPVVHLGLNKNVNPHSEGAFISGSSSIDYHLTYADTIMIDSIDVSDSKVLIVLLDSLIEFAKSINVLYVYLADSYSKSIYSWLLRYGFEDEHVSDGYNYYMRYELRGA